MLTLLEGHEARITDISFSPNQRVLVSTSSDGSVRFWQVAQIQNADQDLPVAQEHGRWFAIRIPGAAIGKQEADRGLIKHDHNR